jgi:LmbE family N-acetylglucosaminyl deacetylase
MNVLVVAAHPDDEVLGCGGTIARHGDHGDRVDILFLADGVGARGDGGEALLQRRAAACRAAAILGAEEPQFRDFPDNRLDSVDLLDIVQSIEAVLDSRAYDLIYTHWEGDLNVDHRIANLAVRTATRPTPGQSVRAVLAFEVPSSSEWAFAEPPGRPPNFAISIASHLERKLDALRAYDMELREPPHPRSVDAVRALAAWRGASHGFAYAEAFSLVRASLP